MQVQPGDNVIILQAFNAICGTVKCVNGEGTCATLTSAFDIFGALPVVHVSLADAKPWTEAPRLLGLADIANSSRGVL